MNNKYLKYGLHLAILVGLIIAGFKYLSGQEVLEALRTFDYRYAPVMLALSIGYVLVKAYRFVVLTQPYTDLPWGVIVRAYVAGQAATLLPGGVVARAGLLKQADVPVSKGTVPVAFSSGLDQAVLLTTGLAAALWFGRGITSIFIILAIVALIVGLLVVPTTRQWFKDAADWVANKFGAEEKWNNFLEAAPQVLTWRIMAIGVGLTVLSFVLHVIILDLTIRGLDHEMDYSKLLLVYILPTVLGRLSGLPGGVGVTEAGMVGFITSLSDIGTNSAVAAVGVFRVVTIVFAALLGAVVYFVGWRGNKEAQASTS